MKEIKWATLQPLCGGMAIGYEQAIGHPPEFIITCGASNDEHYISYMNEKRDLDVPIIHMNGTYDEFDSPEDEKLFNELRQDIDIVAYVPVCAGLSMLNTQVNKDSKFCRGDADNEQNKNMYQTTKCVLTMIKPKVACFENAPTAYTKMGEGVAARLREKSVEFDYRMTMEKTNTFLHGIPQHRKRTFIYFWDSKYCPLIEYEKADTPTLAKYFKQIPKEVNKHIYPFSKYEAKSVDYEFILATYGKPKDKLKDVFLREYPDYETLSCLQFIRWKDDFQNAADWTTEQMKLHPEDSVEYKRYARSLQRYNHCVHKLSIGKGYWDSSTNICYKNTAVNAVVSRNFRGLIHPTKERSMTLREIYWLMGLPHDYDMLDERTRYSQVAQSVPVITAKHTAVQCLKYVDNKLLFSKSKFVKQSNETQRIDYLSEQEEVSLEKFF